VLGKFINEIHSLFYLASVCHVGGTVVSLGWWFRWWWREGQRSSTSTYKII